MNLDEARQHVAQRVKSPEDRKQAVVELRRLAVLHLQTSCLAPDDTATVALKLVGFRQKLSVW